jgi:2-methylcitrate dehydratase
MDLDKKSIPSALTVYLANGDVLDEVLVEFPLGHMENPGTASTVQHKFHRNMALMFSEEEIKEVERSVMHGGDMSISNFLDQLARGPGPKL